MYLIYHTTTEMKLRQAPSSPGIDMRNTKKIKIIIIKTLHLLSLFV